MKGHQIWYQPTLNLIIETNTDEQNYGLSDGEHYSLRILNDVLYGFFSTKSFPEDFVLIGEV